MSDFNNLSISAGYRVDSETGEIIEQLEPNIFNTGIQRPGSYTPSMYTQKSIDIARETTSVLCEKVLSKCTGGRRVQRKNNRGHDIVLPDGSKLEAKVGRIGNSAVIKENQLFDFDSNFWGFMFYRTIKNLPPSFYTSLENNRSPKENLLRNLKIDTVFIFPTKVIRYYWNTASVKRGRISSTGITHRPLTISRAFELLSDLNNIPGIRYLGIQKYCKNDIPLKTVGIKL
ncbi:hypothetical protein LR010_03215 [Candidatus Gracilibacteria bacterium]|nr:hypothetical protein [Candidatus Gracilibacteria bacterium]